MIEEHASPLSQETIEEAVDERIEYRLNGAAILKPDGTRFGSVQTN